MPKPPAIATFKEVNDPSGGHLSAGRPASPSSRSSGTSRIAAHCGRSSNPSGGGSTAKRRPRIGSCNPCTSPRSATLCSRTRSLRIAAGEQSSRAAAGLMQGWPLSISAQLRLIAQPPQGRKTPRPAETVDAGMRGLGRYGEIVLPHAHAGIFLDKLGERRVAPCGHPLNRESGPHFRQIVTVVRQFPQRLRLRTDALSRPVTHPAKALHELHAESNRQFGADEGLQWKVVAGEGPSPASRRGFHTRPAHALQQFTEHGGGNVRMRGNVFVGRVPRALRWRKYQNDRVSACRCAAEHHQISIARQKAKILRQGKFDLFLQIRNQGRIITNPVRGRPAKDAGGNDVSGARSIRAGGRVTVHGRRLPAGLRPAFLVHGDRTGQKIGFLLALDRLY